MCLHHGAGGVHVCDSLENLLSLCWPIRMFDDFHEQEKQIIITSSKSLSLHTNYLVSILQLRSCQYLKIFFHGSSDILFTKIRGFVSLMSTRSRDVSANRRRTMAGLPLWAIVGAIDLDQSAFYNDNQTSMVSSLFISFLSSSLSLYPCGFILFMHVYTHYTTSSFCFSNYFLCFIE